MTVKLTRNLGSELIVSLGLDGGVEAYKAGSIVDVPDSAAEFLLSDKCRLAELTNAKIKAVPKAPEIGPAK